MQVQMEAEDESGQAGDPPADWQQWLVCDSACCIFSQLTETLMHRRYLQSLQAVVTETLYICV